MICHQAIGSLAAALSVVTIAIAAPTAYEGVEGQWTTLARLPEPRQEHGTVAVDDNTIAVIGGVTEVLSDTSVAIGLATTNLVQLYDITSNVWRTVTPAPAALNHPNVAAVNGKLYVLGGLADGPDNNIEAASLDWEASGESHVYDPATDSWSQLESMPHGTERGSAVTAVFGEMVYLAGGMTLLSSSYQDSVTLVTGFNTTSGKWQRLPPSAANIPEGRQHGFGAIIGSTFYVVGGRWFSQTAVRGDVYMLDLDNQEAGWQTSVAQMPVPRGGISGGVIGDGIYTFGGEGNQNSDTGVFNETERFDIQTQKWTESTPMALPRHGTSAATVGGKIYIPGGGLQQDGKPVVINGSTSYLNSTDYFDVFSL